MGTFHGTYSYWYALMREVAAHLRRGISAEYVRFKNRAIDKPVPSCPLCSLMDIGLCSYGLRNILSVFRFLK